MRARFLSPSRSEGSGRRRPGRHFLFLGGALHTLGAVGYGLKRPNPNPRWFGFHEVFYALTIAAFTAHCIGISIALRTV
jgi:hemolysin III